MNWDNLKQCPYSEATKCIAVGTEECTWCEHYEGHSTMKFKLKSWQIPVACSHCNTVFWSSYSGEFVTCTCGDCFCDQTPHYGRYGGDNLMRMVSSSLAEEDEYDVEDEDESMS